MVARAAALTASRRRSAIFVWLRAALAHPDFLTALAPLAMLSSAPTIFMPVAASSDDSDANSAIRPAS